MTRPDEEDNFKGLPSVNRCAIVLQPTEGYLEWAKRCPDGDPDLELEDVCDENTVYLVPEMDSVPDAWLQRNYKVMFEEELYSWCTDPSFWPKDRSFKVFRKYFDVQFSSVVLDLGKEPLMSGGD